VGVSLADLMIEEVLEDLAFALGQMDSDAVPIVPGVAVVTAEPHDIVLLVTLSLFLVLYDVEDDWRRLDQETLSKSWFESNSVVHSYSSQHGFMPPREI
jgi:hypothetical protein